MRLESPLGTTTILMMVGAASAFPNMGNLTLGMNQSEPQISTELIGDLKTLDDSQLTHTGKVVKALLRNDDNVPGEDEATAYPVPLPAKGSSVCKTHTCCIWKHVYNDMRKAMKDAKGDCNDLARAAIRLGFHDAGTWSRESDPLGGADGSIVLAGECESRAENKGLETICQQTRKWYDEYKQYGVGMADLIQLGHNAGTVFCLSGPGVRTFVGRKDRSTPAPEGKLPTQEQSADELISLFGNKTIAPVGLAALVGAHTSAKQRFVDEARAGLPLDRTPEIWDTDFYDLVASDEAPKGFFRLDSDYKLSRHARVQPAWESFRGFMGLFPWLRDYSREYVRLSLLGVDNINSLTECTRVLTDDSPGPIDPEPSTSSHVSSQPATSTHVSPKLSTSSHVPSQPTTSTRASSKLSTSGRVSSSNVATSTHMSDDKKTVATTTPNRTKTASVDASQTSNPVATMIPSASAAGPNPSSSVTPHVPQATILGEAHVKALLELSAKFTFEIRGGLVAIQNLHGKAAAASWRLVYDLDAKVENKFRFEICEPGQQGRVVTNIQGQYVFGLAVSHNVTASGAVELVCDTGSLTHVKVENERVVAVTAVEAKAAVEIGVAIYQCASINQCTKSTCKGNDCGFNLVANGESGVASVTYTFEQCKSGCFSVKTCVAKECGPAQPRAEGVAPARVPVEQVRAVAFAAITTPAVDVKAPGAQVAQKNPSQPQKAASDEPKCIPRRSQAAAPAGPAPSVKQALAPVGSVAPISPVQQQSSGSAPAVKQAVPGPVGSIAPVAPVAPIQQQPSGSSPAVKQAAPAPAGQPNVAPANRVGDIQANVDTQATVKGGNQATDNTSQPASGRAGSNPGAASSASANQGRPIGAASNGTAASGRPSAVTAGSGRVAVAFSILAGIVGMTLFM
ncbi:peroxidase domain-containing protein [Hirsutella rhossiliensis]|uniref:Peroxidase n=1 Tax=Hirsutella rhossiliensis TaxID=111463 RepID=A0A9P8MPV1_9HYPO|nr:peroxidase domain-containing protein [Hirsutella rhossiliensis]KAH0958959.1 peroxidase domain-containing protein [Hirsutella rhossiliensis]